MRVGDLLVLWLRTEQRNSPFDNSEKQTLPPLVADPTVSPGGDKKSLVSSHSGNTKKDSRIFLHLWMFSLGQTQLPNWAGAAVAALLPETTSTIRSIGEL